MLQFFFIYLYSKHVYDTRQRGYRIWFLNDLHGFVLIFIRSFLFHNVFPLHFFFVDIKHYIENLNEICLTTFQSLRTTSLTIDNFSKRCLLISLCSSFLRCVVVAMIAFYSMEEIVGKVPFAWRNNVRKYYYYSTYVYIHIFTYVLCPYVQ